MAEIEVRGAFDPRPLQDKLHEMLSRFNVLVAHRRFGKTVYCVNELIEAAGKQDLPPDPRFAYIAPFYNQSKDIAWSYLKHFGGKVPGVEFNESELRADFPGGSRIRLYGADNADRLRGLYFDGVILDEYAQMNPRVWSEIIRPALADRGGWAIFIGTPMGRNAFADLYDGALNGFQLPDGTRRKDPDWAAFMFKASETGIVPAAELDAARRVMTADQYAQEFECSFDAAIPGTYYAALIAQAEQLGRVKLVPWEPALPVYTAWDLGVNDPTSIWFCQVAYGEVRVIDYYEEAGRGLDYHVANLRAGHRAEWVYAQHFFPHDIMPKEMSDGISRLDKLKGFGLHPTVLPVSSVDDGIMQAKFLIRKMYFDVGRCATGLALLRQYRSEWDEKRQVLKPTPLHDFTSHCADAFRYLAVGLGKHMIDNRPLGDPMLSELNRGGVRSRFAAGSKTGGGKPYGWR